MNYFFITGSSQGIGKALTELLLQDENNSVIGLARTQTIEHKNYTHITTDLSDINQIKNYTFPSLDKISKVTLINNAGIVGDINHIGNIDNTKIIECYNLNLIAPAVLTNNFVSQYSAYEKLIINISSGAGRSPIDGWSIYCSSKAGLDMFSQTINEESKIDNSNLTILSLAPGIIDTGMQSQIRASNKAGFSNIERFIEYKDNGDLSQPEETASQIYQFISKKKLHQNVLCSVRDLKN